MVRLFRWASLPALLFSLNALGANMFGINADKYSWQARESAPKNYPMQVVSGTLFYHGQNQGLYVPDRAAIDYGWGEGISSHVTGADTKPLPDRLEITFFSYTENQFYIGKFKLPYDKILAMFKAGYYSASKDKDITYDEIVVGIAPGGSVSVWLVGAGRTTEVFFGQAEKADVEWSRITTTTPREEEVRLTVLESLKTPEAVAALRKNGIPFGLWRDTYRARYAWQPVFTGLQLGEGGLIRIGRFFNGEQHFLTHPLNKTDAASTRAIPSELSFVGAPPGATGNPKSVKLFFNEAEILDAFKKLGANNQPLQLEMRNEVIDGQNRFTVWLRNDKESIQLKRTEVKTYNT